MPRWVLPVGGLLFIITGVNASIINKGISEAMPHYHLLYGACSMLLVTGYATCTNSTGILFRFFVFLGRASYSIYLIHFAVLSAIIELLMPLEMNSYVNFVILFLSGVLIGSLLYQYIERPLLQFTRKKLKIAGK